MIPTIPGAWRDSPLPPCAGKVVQRRWERACCRVSALFFFFKHFFCCVCFFFKSLLLSPKKCHLRKNRFACNPDFSPRFFIFLLIFFLFKRKKKERRVKQFVCVFNHLLVIFNWYESCFVGTGSKQGYIFSFLIL